jgi:hypothetical protein
VFTLASVACGLSQNPAELIVLIQFVGMSDGWRWVFLVNLFIGAVEVPVAVKALPRRHEREEHDLDVTGSVLLTGVLLLLLIPLVDGRVSGWPTWSRVVLQVQLLRQHRSFALGQSLALLYFAGFTSLFFTLSILWQQGLGRSALQTGLLVLPFSVASLSTASNSYRFSTRLGRQGRCSWPGWATAWSSRRTRISCSARYPRARRARPAAR